MTTRPVCRTLLFMALCITIAGCAGGLLSSGYRGSLSKWTSRAAIYSGLDTRLIIHATYRGAEFKEAYLTQYFQIYGVSEEARAQRRSADMADEESFTEVLVGVFTQDPSFNDLGSPASIWRLYIETPDGPIHPFSVTRADDSALFRQMYPHIDPWSTPYVVRFPKHTETSVEPFPGPDAKELRMVITGVPGRAELVWSLSD